MDNIDIYYESIKQVYEQILNWPKPKQPVREKIVDWILGITITLFIISLIPILPFVFVLVGKYYGLIIASIDLSKATVNNFGAIWLISSGATLLFMLMMIWINEKVDSLTKYNPAPPQSLSPEQLTFIAVYESYKELKIFFVSHVEQHIQKSLMAIGRLSNHRRSIRHLKEEMELGIMFDEVRNSSTHWVDANFGEQVDIASSFLKTFEKYAWFQLDPKTKSILQAIISFSQKIPDRLVDKQDLPTILSIMENLSRFLYAYLPEHKTNMEAVDLELLQSEGAKSLNKFTKEVNELTSYSHPRIQKDDKNELSPAFFEKIKDGFYDNVFFRFSVWFVLILALTSGAVILINQRLTLSPDTMATLIVGTSVASAAALASFLPKKTK